jgi:integrase
MPIMRTDDKVMKPVKPIKNIDDVQRIRKMLKKSPRNLLLFDIATQTGLKLGEALGLKVKDVLEMDDGKISFLSPNALGVKMSREIRYSLRRHVETARLAGEDNLFKSRKGDKPLNASSASNIVNTWFKAAGLKASKPALNILKLQP